ncbi:hypothetical protein HMPREF9081_0511 [Centipeda periodontii DSM 2778]|uniref:Uncharacterized protein n=1 Tax=Centipeda periodontii DSM 2778 TaxID=888060 RepID=F5RJU0_9FIRM|nr:hypothetical protein HMPREF9081_0511 [Centipeda periodontii DSM 2778]
MDKYTSPQYKIWNAEHFFIQYMVLSTVLSTLSTENGRAFGKIMHTV